MPYVLGTDLAELAGVGHNSALSSHPQGERGSPQGYARRRPEESVLYGVVESELETFLARAHARAHARERPVPRFVERELRGFLGWNLIGTRVIHRIGPLMPNDQIVLVLTAGGHRREAFHSCEFIIDYLKTAAPFWKREQTGHGGKWLETRDSDIQRMEHWIKAENKS